MEEAFVKGNQNKHHTAFLRKILFHKIFFINLLIS